MNLAFFSWNAQKYDRFMITFLKTLKRYIWCVIYTNNFFLKGACLFEMPKKFF